MRLYLVQHGDAMPKEENPQRPLSVRGRLEVQRMAMFLGQAGVKTPRIFHSGKLRAQETAEILASALAPGEGIQQLEGIAPLDPPRPVAEKAAAWSEDTLLAGHMPFMAKLASRLLGLHEESRAVTYQQGSVVCLERNNEGRWSICWMVRPELLEAKP